MDYYFDVDATVYLFTTFEGVYAEQNTCRLNLQRYEICLAACRALSVTVSFMISLTATDELHVGQYAHPPRPYG